jgi:hypothetical protein
MHKHNLLALLDEFRQILADRFGIDPLAASHFNHDHPQFSFPRICA